MKDESRYHSIGMSVAPAKHIVFVAYLQQSPTVSTLKTLRLWASPSNCRKNQNQNQKRALAGYHADEENPHPTRIRQSTHGVIERFKKHEDTLGLSHTAPSREPCSTRTQIKIVKRGGLV